MSTNKFIAIGGFSLAIAAVGYQITNSIPIEVAIFFSSCLLLYLLMFLEKKIRDFQGEFLNKFFYHLNRTDAPYIIEYAETTYEYISMTEMKYSKDIELKSRVDNLQKFEDKFCWSSYSKDMEVLPKYPGQKINHLASRNLWNVIEIDFGERCKKGKTVKTGMDIVGLHDELGIAKPFLSHHSDRKIKERVMTVKIPKELKPKNAKYEIYKASGTGKVIKSEPLEYDNTITGFSKRILYPRSGWTYAIVWEWDE